MNCSRCGSSDQKMCSIPELGYALRCGNCHRYGPFAGSEDRARYEWNRLCTDLLGITEPAKTTTARVLREQIAEMHEMIEKLRVYPKVGEKQSPTVHLTDLAESWHDDIAAARGSGLDRHTELPEPLEWGQEHREERRWRAAVEAMSGYAKTDASPESIADLSVDLADALLRTHEERPLPEVNRQEPKVEGSCESSVKPEQANARCERLKTPDTRSHAYVSRCLHCAKEDWERFRRDTSLGELVGEVLLSLGEAVRVVGGQVFDLVDEEDQQPEAESEPRT